MTKKLAEIFNLPDDESLDSVVDSELTLPDTIDEIDEMIERVDSALPTVKNLDSSDQELDELAAKATETFEDLLSLGMNVDSRYASEILSVASTMFGHALSAKQTKLTKKLKMVELQLKKARLDLDINKANKAQEQPVVEEASGQILSRNDLLARILSSNQNSTE